MKDLLKILEKIDKMPWKCEINNKEIVCLANNFFDKSKYTKKNLCFRIFGLSGCGKTTQILPAIKSVCQKNNLKPLHLAVRNFAKFHPNYKNLLINFGQENIREKTNAFAIKMLVCVLYFAIKNNIDIIFEVTLLKASFEKKLQEIFKKNGYKLFYFSICANAKDCKKLIEIRKTNNGKEKGRIVNKKTAKAFEKYLLNSLKLLCNFGGRFLFWNLKNEKPLFDGNIKTGYKIYLKNYKLSCLNQIKNPELLAKAKMLYLNKKFNLAEQYHDDVF